MRIAPILLVNFNRPDFTKDQIDTLRRFKPNEIYASVDGPRPNHPEDVIQVAMVKEELSKIDWNCRVHTYYRDVNRGCRNAPPEAISWFFEHVDAGIIIEDDCCPTESFLYFATELLDRYKDEQSVGAISGYNRYGFQTSKTDSYHFETNWAVWGWATWKRVWQEYNVDISSYQDRFDKLAERYCLTPLARHLYRSALAQSATANTWDYQFSALLTDRKLLTIKPAHNLIRNVGYCDTTGTHTSPFIYNDIAAKEACTLQFPLSHPAKIEFDSRAQKMTEDREYGIVPRGITWLGCKVPRLQKPLKTIGLLFERILPLAFRV